MSRSTMTRHPGGKNTPAILRQRDGTIIVLFPDRTVLQIDTDGRVRAEPLERAASDDRRTLVLGAATHEEATQRTGGWSPACTSSSCPSPATHW
jgi:hypothetical protein